MGSKISCVLTCLILASIHPVQAADTVGPQLRVQIENARPQLGELPDWQEEIFQNEVLMSSGRFVRDYRTNGAKVTKVDVDLQGIKKYLTFNASQILKPGANKVILFVRGNAACTDCAKAILTVRADLKARLERRGLVVNLATVEELKRDPSDAFAKQNANGWVLAEIRAEEDPDHPGDNRYALLLDFRFPGTVISGTQKTMEILPTDSIEISMSRLSIDAFLELGQKTKTGFSASSTEAPGIELVIDGANQFPILTQMKTKLQASLGSDYRVVEKRIERGGRASLAVLSTTAGEKNAPAIAAALKKTVFEGFQVQVVNVSDERVDIRVAAAASGGTL